MFGLLGSVVGSGGLLANAYNALGGNQALLGGALGAMGLSQANKVQGVNQNFDYDLASSNYNQNNQMNAAISKMGGLGDEFSQSYRQMLSPGSQYNQRLFQNLRQNVADTGNQTINQMNTAMASRGIGGMGSLFDAIQNRAGGEAYSQGMTNIMNQSAQQAGQFGQLASNMYNQAGSLASQADARALQNEQFNVGNQNQYQSELVERQYNQAVNNANMANSMQAQKSKGLFGLAGNVIGDLFNKG